MPTWNDVVELGRRLPQVEVTTWWGTPALKVAGQGFCRIRSNPDALVIRVLDLADREALMLGRPEVFFITPHYREVPYVLVDLERVEPAELAEMVQDAWRLLAPAALSADFATGTDAATGAEG